MSIVSKSEDVQQTVPVAQYDVVVVGAGPYGMATAAHLLGKGLRVAIFGKPLELWREHMPKNMYLRSHWWATSLSDPRGAYSISRFFKTSTNYKECYPLPIEAFIDYADWFQKHAVPDVDKTYVSSIERSNGQFLLTLADGRIVQCAAVVIAIGVYYYAKRPAEYNHLPGTLVSHSFEHADYNCFAGKRIAMIGAGQSAVEYAALAHEAGATVHLICRKAIHWLGPDRSKERTLWEQIKAPTAGIAPGWRNWILEHIPYFFYHFPQERKDRYIRNNYQAAASDWLRDRVIGEVHLHEKQQITSMQEVDGKVELSLSNGETLRVDHVVLATGYEVNIHKLPMLHPSLKAEIKTDKDIPLLSSYFESSVPGLYFIGLTSLRSFGPLYRFVVGNKATAQRVAGAVARQVRSR